MRGRSHECLIVLPTLSWQPFCRAFDHRNGSVHGVSVLYYSVSR
ncbi:conserved hypothetical protein [Ahrensia sp. R2A130]|nr:conserved hypothetical protein [Ahrensia sp. R2A130]